MFARLSAFCPLTTAVTADISVGRMPSQLPFGVLSTAHRPRSEGIPIHCAVSIAFRRSVHCPLYLEKCVGCFPSQSQLPFGVLSTAHRKHS